MAESSTNSSSNGGNGTAKLVKSQISSVDIRLPNEKTLDPLVMDIIREDTKNAKEQRDELLGYLRTNNSESDYSKVTSSLNRDGSLTSAERIVHRLYGYGVAKETLEQLDTEASQEESWENLTNTVLEKLSDISTGNQEMKAAVESSMGDLKTALSDGFEKSDTSSKANLTEISKWADELKNSITRMEEKMGAIAGNVSESSKSISKSICQLIESMEKNTTTLAKIMEKGIDLLSSDAAEDDAKETKPSRRRNT